MQILVTTRFSIQAYVTIPGGFDLIICTIPLKGLFTSTDLSWLFKEIQHQKGNNRFAGKERSRCRKIPGQSIYLHFYRVLKSQQSLVFNPSQAISTVPVQVTMLPCLNDIQPPNSSHRPSYLPGTYSINHTQHYLPAMLP